MEDPLLYNNHAPNNLTNNSVNEVGNKKDSNHEYDKISDESVEIIISTNNDVLSTSSNSSSDRITTNNNDDEDNNNLQEKKSQVEQSTSNHNRYGNLEDKHVDRAADTELSKILSSNKINMNSSNGFNKRATPEGEEGQRVAAVEEEAAAAKIAALDQCIYNNISNTNTKGSDSEEDDIVGFPLDMSQSQSASFSPPVLWKKDCPLDDIISKGTAETAPTTETTTIANSGETTSLTTTEKIKAQAASLSENLENNHITTLQQQQQQYHHQQQQQIQQTNSEESFVQYVPRDNSNNHNHNESVNVKRLEERVRELENKLSTLSLLLSPGLISMDMGNIDNKRKLKLSLRKDQRNNYRLPTASASSISSSSPPPPPPPPLASRDDDDDNHYNNDDNNNDHHEEGAVNQSIEQAVIYATNKAAIDSPPPPTPCKSIIKEARVPYLESPSPWDTTDLSNGVPNNNRDSPSDREEEEEERQGKDIEPQRPRKNLSFYLLNDDEQIAAGAAEAIATSSSHSRDEEDNNHNLHDNGNKEKHNNYNDITHHHDTKKNMSFYILDANDDKRNHHEEISNIIKSERLESNTTTNNNTNNKNDDDEAEHFYDTVSDLYSKGIDNTDAAVIAAATANATSSIIKTTTPTKINSLVGSAAKTATPISTSPASTVVAAASSPTATATATASVATFTPTAAATPIAAAAATTTAVTAITSPSPSKILSSYRLLRIVEGTTTTYQQDDKKKKEVRNRWLDHLNSYQESNRDVDLQMQEFIKVPGAVESLLRFAFWICIDSYLYVCTILPIRFVWSCFLLLLTICVGGGISGGSGTSTSSTTTAKTTTTGASGGERRIGRLPAAFQFHRRHMYQLIQGGIIYIIYRYVLCNISIGKLYHWIRGQSLIKLYVVIAIVEVFDRLMCSVGQDCLDSMYWNTTRRPKSLRIYISILVVIVYATIHTLLLFVHVATLNVAMNSADQALLGLLISGNFAEIKSTVFKKYNKPNLFKITTSDICERFKLTLFLVLVLLLNLAQGMDSTMMYDYSVMCGIVWIAEVLSDWIKHSFITKFNFIPHTVYREYGLLLAGDIMGIGHEGVNLDHSHAVVKRIGFAQIPLICVTLRMLREAFKYQNYKLVNADSSYGSKIFVCTATAFAIWIFLLICKISLGIYLENTCLKKFSEWTKKTETTNTNNATTSNNTTTTNNHNNNNNNNSKNTQPTSAQKQKAS